MLCHLPFPLTDAELTLLKTAPTAKEMTPGVLHL